MAGTNIEHYSGRGINFRALDDLFALNEQRKGEVSVNNRHLCYCRSRPAAYTTDQECKAACKLLAQAAQDQLQSSRHEPFSKWCPALRLHGSC